MAKATVMPVLEILGREYRPVTALEFANPLQLLVSTILSAQCTDERVNQVTRTLFKTYRRAEDFAQVSQETLEGEIHSTGFFRNKAKAIRGMAQRLVEHYDSRVPESMEELLTLPGVARKTANVVLGSAFGKAQGVVVDTHVKRVAARLGWTPHTDPEKIEKDLMKIVPQSHWIEAGHLLIHHGRKICEARRPRCSQCPVAHLCPSAGTVEGAR